VTPEEEVAWWRTSFLTRLVSDSFFPKPGEEMLGKRLRIVDVRDEGLACDRATEIDPALDLRDDERTPNNEG
jgi:hypothetical protein